MNRAPGPNDLWWKDHQRNCGGSFVKIKEPEGYGQKKIKAGGANKVGRYPQSICFVANLTYVSLIFLTKAVVKIAFLFFSWFSTGSGNVLGKGQKDIRSLFDKTNLKKSPTKNTPIKKNSPVKGKGSSKGSSQTNAGKKE